MVYIHLLIDEFHHSENETSLTAALKLRDGDLENIDGVEAADLTAGKPLQKAEDE